MSASEIEKLDLAGILNKECHCSTLDLVALGRVLEGGESAGLYQAIVEARPHLFSATPVFIDEAQVARMGAIIAAVEQVVATPAYRAHVLRWATPLARYEPGARGVFLGYDFHLGATGPQLIEINTNAGGAMLNLVLGRAQQVCCEGAGTVVGLPGLEHAFLAMFLAEWRLQRGDAPLTRVAIVDTDPAEQYLAPEFLLFQQLFKNHGIDALILDPRALQLRDGKLWAGEVVIDLVYNRLTDFALTAPVHAALRAAYENDAVVLTPHPHAHAIYADKRNLTVLSDTHLLREWGVAADVVALLASAVPHAVLVTPDLAESLWSNRRGWFFKPAGGYGGKAVYRGDKLTKRVFAEIVQGDYIAQALVPPSERHAHGDLAPLKMDWRQYVYNGTAQLLAARLYQGQTTNFRTAGGGFAPVFYATTVNPGACPLAEKKVCAN